MISALAIAGAVAASLPDGVQLSLVPSAAEYRIGAPVWITLVVENGSERALDARDGACTALSRGERLRLEVTRQGAEVPDPYVAMAPRMNGPPMGPAIGARVGAGETGRLTVDLNRFAWLDTPGTYTVRLFHPLGLDPVQEPSELPIVLARSEPSADDPRWVEAQVTLRAPAPDELFDVIGTRTTRRAVGADDTPDLLEGLGHARFVPLLEYAAKGGPVAPYPRHPSAIDALALCPCTEATDALLRVRALRGAPDERRRIDNALLDRIPYPSFGSRATDASLIAERDRRRWFAEQAWAGRHAAPLRELAKAALAQGPAWEGAHHWAERVLDRLDASTAP